MLIQNIEIKNYKSCNKTFVEFNNKLTTLIGINGSGKTSILSAINLLKLACSERTFFEINKPINKIFETILKVSFLNKNTEIKLKATFNYDTVNNMEEIISQAELEWEIPKLNTKKLKIPTSYSHSFFNELPNEFYKHVSEVTEFIKTINYYSATQFSDPRNYPSSVEIEEKENSNIYNKTFLIKHNNPHANFIIDLIKLKFEFPDKYERYFNLIGPRGMELITDISFEKVEFDSMKIIPNKVKKVIFVPKVFLAKKVLSFNQLSEGTLKTMALVFYIIKNENSLLLIEEPEVCVHHGLLNSIIEVIKSETDFKQIIISTHSDFVLDQITPDNLVIITRNDETGTIAKKLSKTLSKKDYKSLHLYLESVGNLGDFWKEGGFNA